MSQRISAVAAFMLAFSACQDFTAPPLIPNTEATFSTSTSGGYVVHSLGTLDGDRTGVTCLYGCGTAIAVNESGLIIGGGNVMWDHGQAIELGFFPRDLNDEGQIAGSMWIGTWSGGEGQVVVWDDGVTTILDSLGISCGLFTHSVKINRTGQVIGHCLVDDGESRAFLWSDGIMTDLGTLGGTHWAGEGSVALALNNRGVVVGYSYTPAGDKHAVLWKDGVILDLGTLGGTSSWANDINDLGHIVGTSYTTSGEWHAFLWKEGVMTDLGTLCGGYSDARFINEPGQIVGYTGCGAFFWEHGRMTNLDPQPPIGGGGLGLDDLNDRGHVVGWRSGGAFVWQNGIAYDLPMLPGGECCASHAAAINEHGWIVGDSDSEYTDYGGTMPALWTPLHGRH